MLGGSIAIYPVLIFLAVMLAVAWWMYGNARSGRTPPAREPRPRCAAGAGSRHVKTRSVYLLLAVLGTALPYSHFLQFVWRHGLDLRLLVTQLFANPISSFFAWDVIVSTVVLWVFVGTHDTGRRATHRWAPIVASLTVGVSLALPLFLYLRETRN
jgi:hypothetical protein